MLIELNRFITTEEVRAAYQVPDALADRILQALPVAFESPDGTRYHLESEVDEFFAEFVRRQRHHDESKQVPRMGRPGRKVETLEIALYAQELKQQKMIWKDIWKLCKVKWPNDDRVKSKERVRGTWNRFFSPNARTRIDSQSTLQPPPVG